METHDENTGMGKESREAEIENRFVGKEKTTENRMGWRKTGLESEETQHGTTLPETENGLPETGIVFPETVTRLPASGTRLPETGIVFQKTGIDFHQTRTCLSKREFKPEGKKIDSREVEEGRNDDWSACFCGANGGKGENSENGGKKGKSGQGEKNVKRGELEKGESGHNAEWESGDDGETYDSSVMSTVNLRIDDPAGVDVGVRDLALNNNSPSTRGQNNQK